VLALPLLLVPWALADDDEAEPEVEIHAYAEANAELLRVGTDPRFDGQGRLRRAALEFEHEFEALPLEVELELEVEDALASSGGPGRVEIEEAFLSWEPRETWTLQAGLLLVPMGWVNLHHMPDEYNGVERPSLDQILLPSTWRELGLGARWERQRWSAELDLMSALDPTGFDDAGIVNGRTLGASSPVDAGALVGRVEWGADEGSGVGLSGYASNVGSAADWYDASGERLRLWMPVLGAELDARLSLAGVEARAEGVLWSLPQSDDLMDAWQSDGAPYFPAAAGVVPTAMLGGYVELGYDVLHPFGRKAQLVPFARLEHDDTQRAVPEGYEANPLRTVNEGTFGLSFRPADGLVFKGDVVLRDREYGDDELGIDFGLGVDF